MPGPKSTPNPAYKREAEYTRANERVAKRLEARIADYEVSVKNGAKGFNKPGSQKR